MQEVLINRAVVEVAGEDALKFVQNLITGDLYKNDYFYSYLLSSQGRYLFDFFVYREEGGRLIIDIDASQVSAFKSRLLLYRLRSKVEINDISETHMVLYSNQIIENALYSKRDPRFDKLSFRSVVSGYPELGLGSRTEFGMPSHSMYLHDKYEYAIPDGASDLAYDKSIPIEYGAEELGAISYTKGCYVGQELISRTKYQGEVRKKIFKVTANEDLEAKGSEVMVGDKSIGIVCSCYKNNAIALLREERYLELAEKIATINGIEAVISVPDWRK